jgi:uncharacterized membrane protein YfcA
MTPIVSSSPACSTLAGPLALDPALRQGLAFTGLMSGLLSGLLGVGGGFVIIRP